MISSNSSPGRNESGLWRHGFFQFVARAGWRLALCALGLASAGDALASGEAISYNNQIGPILSEHCFHCHGPDSAARKPKKNPLRLDRADFAYKSRDNGQPVIVQGDPGASELVRRISATDDDIMPPAAEHNPLKPEEIALLKQWVSQGAKYEKHWSLIPPVKPAASADGKSWARNPIDNFVARKLAQNGLTPNPEEQKARLYRRLSFDLTGLPPNPHEMDEFVRSGSDKAYEKAVDRMLASDGSAEHFARLWLDAVRYADTQGIHIDWSRSVWLYRDWVINAYKTNMPFDQFTVEQIAGDMLPNPTQDQKIASGYNRMLETTSEAGIIPSEYTAIYAKDRVDTTTAVWLGLTAGCATCHDHKFDPITMKDFYSLTAFFRNTVGPIQDGPTGNMAPMVFVPAKGDEQKWGKTEKEIGKTKKSITTRTNEAEPDFQHWLAQTKANPIPRPVRIPALLSLPLTESNGPCVGDLQGKRIQWAGGTEKKAGLFGSAPLIAGQAVEEQTAPVIVRNEQASYGAFIYIEDKPTGGVISRMNVNDGFRGWDIFLAEGRPLVHVVDQYPDKALKISAKEALNPGHWHHLMAVFDGTQSGAKAIALYVDGLKAEVDVENNNLGTNIAVNVPLRLGARSGTNGAADVLSVGRVFLQDVRFYNKALPPEDIARLALNGLARDKAMTNAADLKDAYLVGYDHPSQKLNATLVKLKATREELRKRGATTLVTAEKKDGKPMAHVLLRGNYSAEGEEVSAATPAALPPMTPDEPRNRLGFARWMISRDNPLVARVTINRLWSQIFGTGIVETTEDFGVMGARPSDQALLDWLAVEFMDSGWNFRHMVKTIVMSATYRQSEAISPEKLEKDPQNRLLSRGPHYRLDAEEIRDQALAASGLLVEKVGGPPVKPYQPEGVWETVTMKESDTKSYQQDTGPSLYRRSLYTYWKRTAPPASMEILNAPSRETFCTRREHTDTPLQALVTLNDTQFVEASRQLAARAILSSPKFNDRLDNITKPLLGRTFAPEERSVVYKMEQDFLRHYQDDWTDAAALVAVGDSKINPRIPTREWAVWTLVASEVLNLDESLTK